MRLSNVLFVILSCFCLILFTSCVTPGTKTTVTSGQGGASINEAKMEAYDGPKARVAVSRFTNKSSGGGGGGGWYSPSIGDGMADQLTTALFNSNRYIVLERETLGDIISEQDLGASGRVKKGTEAQIGEIEGAELLVVGAITEFSGNSSGGSGALNALGLSMLGNIAGGFQKAHMAIDIRMIDAKTSRILAATSVEGEATDIKLGGGLSGSDLSAGLGGWKNTPMEKAMRICIQKAVEFIASKTPQQYYRHGQISSSPATTINQSVPASTSTKTGLSKSTVQKMQSHLAALGYNVGKPDGIPGKKTKQAVLDFQMQYGLETTGKLDPPTIKKIEAVAGQ